MQHRHPSGFCYVPRGENWRLARSISLASRRSIIFFYVTSKIYIFKNAILISLHCYISFAELLLTLTSNALTAETVYWRNKFVVFAFLLPMCCTNNLVKSNEYTGFVPQKSSFEGKKTKRRIIKIHKRPFYLSIL